MLTLHQILQAAKDRRIEAVYHLDGKPLDFGNTSAVRELVRAGLLTADGQVLPTAAGQAHLATAPKPSGGKR